MPLIPLSLASEGYWQISLSLPVISHGKKEKKSLRVGLEKALLQCRYKIQYFLKMRADI